MVTEVWLVDLDRAAAGLEAIERQRGRMAREDLSRIAETGVPELARQRRLSIIATRLLIARCVGSDRFDRVAFRRLAGGKPVLEGDGPAFSYAHADGRVLVAVGEVEAIGVDIEPARSLRMSAERRRLLIDAAAALAACNHAQDDAGPLAPGEGDEQAALRAWVRLEAYAKALGCGIGRVLTERGVIARSRQGLRADRDGANGSALEPNVAVRDLGLPADASGRAWFGAIAVAGKGAAEAVSSLRLDVLPSAAEALAGLTTRD